MFLISLGSFIVSASALSSGWHNSTPAQWSATEGSQAAEPANPSEDPPTEKAEDKATLELSVSAEELLRQLDEGEILGPDGESLTPERKKALREALESGVVTTIDDPEPTGEDNGDIVVRAPKPRGSVPGDFEPLQSFNPNDIKAFGVGNVGELLDALGAEVSSNGGSSDSNAVVLLNGKRVSSFLEIATIPTEAIERMEIFPVEVALQYGFSATQRVVNIITYENFQAQTGLANGSVTTEGGYETGRLNFNYFQIARDTRYTLDLGYTRTGSLLESERGLEQPDGPPDLGAFRTLLPESEGIFFHGTVNARPIEGVSSTINVRVSQNDRQFLIGPGALGPVIRDFETSDLVIGAVLAGQIGRWSWNLFGNYQRSRSDILTGEIDGVAARDEASFVDETVDLNALASGRIFKLPGGPAIASVRIGGQSQNFDSRETPGDGAPESSASLSRDVFDNQVSLDIPVFYRKIFGPDWIGNLSANVNYALSDLSDFGAIETLGYGIVWAPSDAINFTASISRRETAPTPQQLNAPLITTQNVRTFDFNVGETVEFTQLFGGNPTLQAEERETIRLALRLKPFKKTKLIFDIDYLDSGTDNPIAAFPALTSPIELAFPDRVSRDQAGQLVSINAAPVNFARSYRKQLRWGAIFSRSLGDAPAEEQGETMFFGSREDLENSLPPGAIVVDVEPGSAQARQFDIRASRLRLSLYHTVIFDDKIVASENGPTLNLLDGDAIGNEGGTSRHRIEFQASVFKKGLGARIDANWQSGTVVRGIPIAATSKVSDVQFPSLATFDLSLFASISDQFSQDRLPGWLKGVRINLDIVNLFNARQSVTDTRDMTPIDFQSPFFDPQGRQISLSIRKVF
ncbi:TonB-dependent receptor domain-containing protein [Erythrobacter sp. MTPC3]|uniref:TonB-dependent receptor domain-containing protein n=1 Tax=Erythrobacter sp. MTPC3 TaxID=3056564 RepID=UPI0036F2AF66